MPSSVQVIKNIYKCYLYANLIKVQRMTQRMEFTKGYRNANYNVTDD